ncbi:MAG TPA: hypothetical protein VMG60_15985 [Burkholderiaceae bacterium]|nr:hypothetical protein [Burkholderiaceae bacterium]
MRRTGRIVLPALLAGAMSLVATAAGRVPQPAYDVDKSTTCVAPPAEMRRTHMDLLKHRRDETVHAGVRGGKTSLEACIDCHAGKAGGTVTGRPGAFCEACHAYAGVRLDCFECHQPQRGAGTKVSGAEVPAR